MSTVRENMTFYKPNKIKFILDTPENKFMTHYLRTDLDIILFQNDPIAEIYNNLITIDEYIDVMILEKILNKNYF